MNGTAATRRDGSHLDRRRIAAAALASLPAMTPSRLRRLLVHFGGPEPAVEAVGAGRGPRAFADLRPRAAEVAREWAAALDVPTIATTLRQRATRVWIDGDDDYPIRDPVPDRPPVLLGEGARTDAWMQPRVAIVGTRSATPHGLADARELGAFLASAGITVVSGLALGIDGAAHEGALAAGGAVVGVVATGLDVTYPRRHRSLYERVRGAGLIVSEHAYGTAPHAARFPVRNRIIAAVADAVVVVEATATGGARITAGYAAEYGRPVFALPGSRRNEAAAGCNALIADGALCLLEPGDVLIALGAGRAAGGWAAPAGVPARPDEEAVLRALAGESATVDQLVVRTGVAADGLAGTLRRLEQAGRIVQNRGRWWP